jgi:hypothetical protein
MLYRRLSEMEQIKKHKYWYFCSVESLSMEAEESPLLEATTKQQLVKTRYTGMTWSVL